MQGITRECPNVLSIVLLWINVKYNCGQKLQCFFSLLTVGVDGYCYTWSHSTIPTCLHTYTHTHLAVLPWSRDRLIAETSKCIIHTINKRRTFIPPTRFEPAIPSRQRMQTHNLDSALTGIVSTNVSNLLVWLEIFSPMKYIQSTLLTLRWRRLLSKPEYSLNYVSTWKMKIFKLIRVTHLHDGPLTSIRIPIHGTSHRCRHPNTRLAGRLCLANFLVIVWPCRPTPRN